MELTAAASLIVCVICVRYVSCAPLTDGDVVDQDDLNGDVLENLGEKLKIPLLQIIGRTIENVEKRFDNLCDLHRCSPWTEWQGCDARPGQFGSKFRTRQCGVNATTCKLDGNSRPEKESSICIGFCPKDYNETKNGYCIKLYTDKKRNQDDAEQNCKKDGGHLINIDSEVKYEDVNNMLQGFAPAVWIDGLRKDVSSPWEYTYGSQKGFFKWCSTCPSNGSTELCIRIYLSSDSIIMNDYSCTSTRYSLCEITEKMW